MFAVTGVESTGKSTLSRFIADHFNGLLVPEFARDYLDKNGPDYGPQDLDKIALGQAAAQQKAAQSGSDLVVFDTELTVLKIWSEVKYGTVSSTILGLYEEQDVDLFLLPFIDIPWVFDPLREDQNNRRVLFDIYKSEMMSQSIPFAIIRGNPFDRNYAAIRSVMKYLK